MHAVISRGVVEDGCVLSVVYFPKCTDWECGIDPGLVRLGLVPVQRQM